MKIRDLKDVRDLRDLSTNDLIDLVDQLRGTAGRRGLELLDRGRVQARRAIGAPDHGVVPAAFVAGIALGVTLGAALALLWTPAPGREMRRRLGQQVERVRESVPTMSGNGRVREGELTGPDTGMTVEERGPYSASPS